MTCQGEGRCGVAVWVVGNRDSVCGLGLALGFRVLGLGFSAGCDVQGAGFDAGFGVLGFQAGEGRKIHCGKQGVEDRV